MPSVARAAFAERVHELVSFLVDVRGMSSVPGAFAGRVTYHDGCSGLRELKIKQQPRRLLAAVPGLELIEMPGTDTCCGFGGLFSVKFPDISNAMVTAKPGERRRRRAGAAALRRARLPDERRRQAVAAGLAGRLPACRRGARRRNGRAADRARRRREARREARRPHSRRASPPRSPTRRCRRRSPTFRRASSPARARAKAALPEFEALRRTGRDIRDHTLAHLDLYLEAFESNATRAGSRVHWAATGADACDIILGICREAGARVVTKSKSMVSEEVGLRARLEAAALDVVETDLGEYIIQIRGETPSHIIAPAIHLRAGDVADEFRRRHGHLQPGAISSTPEALVGEARGVLREKFLTADVGITGANFLVAETGSAIVVTNEGNADLTMSLPKVHIVLASIDKVVPTLDDAWPLLRLLARSATGQEFTAYTTLVTGPRRAGRRRRARGLPRRHPRQRPLGAAAHASCGRCCAASAAAPA